MTIRRRHLFSTVYLQGLMGHREPQLFAASGRPAILFERPLPKQPRAVNGQRGFTLVEMAVAMLMGGLLMGAVSAQATSYLKQQKVDRTKSSVETVQAALAAYKSAHGALPCPARRDVGENSPLWGAAGDCADTSVGVNTCSNGVCVRPGREEVVGSGNPMRVRVGAVPFKALNLPASATRDGYGYALTYAVTEQLAVDSATAAGHKGAIDVVDAVGNSQLETAGTGEFFLFSHGRDGAGAFTYATGNRNAVACPAGSPEWKNCADTAPATFSAAAYSTAGGVNAADDVAAYQLAVAVAASTPASPSEAITVLGLSCPAGTTVAYQGDMVGYTTGDITPCLEESSMKMKNVGSSTPYYLSSAGTVSFVDGMTYGLNGGGIVKGVGGPSDFLFSMGAGCSVCVPENTKSSTN